MSSAARSVASLGTLGWSGTRSASVACSVSALVTGIPVAAARSRTIPTSWPKRGTSGAYERMRSVKPMRKRSCATSLPNASSTLSRKWRSHAVRPTEASSIPVIDVALSVPHAQTGAGPADVGIAHVLAR